MLSSLGWGRRLGEGYVGHHGSPSHVTSVPDRDRADQRDRRMGIRTRFAEVLIRQQSYQSFFRRGRGDYFQGVLFLAELSTPFICLGKVLIQFHQQQTLLHKLNGAAVIFVFFCCRVLLFPYLYYTYSRYSSVPLYLVPLEVPWPCNLGAGLLMGLQVYWFILICRGALRLLLHPATP
ncbi:unnamed protein product [Merluccius merluccius]